MTITVQQSEDPPWGGPPVLRGHSPAQYYTEHYLTPARPSVCVLNRMDAKSKLTLFFSWTHTVEHKGNSIVQQDSMVPPEFFLEPGKVQPA